MLLQERLARAVLATFCMFGAAIAQVTGEPLTLDGIATDIAEAAFLKEKPDARPLGSAGPDKQGTFYLYFPKDLDWSNHRIETLGRGFEDGRGCAVAIGFSPLSEIEAIALLHSIEDRFRDRFESRSDSAKNQWFFLESSDYYVSAIIPAVDTPDADRPTSVSLSLKSCNADLAATRWQTRPR